MIMEITKVGVVGCGIMGHGIAQVSAQSGYQVIVSEVNEELLKRGLAAIESSLTRLTEKGKIKPLEKDATLARISGTTDMNDFAACDLMVEAATEKLDVKQGIFAQLDKVCPKAAILATNTSSVSVIDVASVTTRQHKVLGMHFFNPAQVMKLLEIVKTIATSDETVKTAKAFGNSIGKTVIVAKNTPAFVVNRLAVPFLLNAMRMFEAGIASKEDIDTGVTQGLNHPMGPLALADFIGLDTLYFLACGAYEDTKDPMWIPPILLKDMVTAGWHGRKTGKGFYDYR